MATQSPNSDNSALRTLVDSVRDYAIFTLDTEGRVLSWNAGAKRIKGYEPEEIIGQHFARFYPPAEVAAGKPARQLAKARAQGSLEEEGLRVRKDGSMFWARVVINALRDPNGKLIGYGKVTQDLTQRRRLTFLGDVSSALLSSLDYRATLLQVAELTVPFVADWCAIHLSSGEQIELVAAKHTDASKTERVRQAFASHPETALREVISSRKPLILPARSQLEALFSREAAPTLRELGAQSVAVVPLTSNNHAVGTLTLVQGASGRHYREADLPFLEDIGRRCGVAIENSEVHQEVATDRARLSAEAQVRERWMAVLGHDLRSPLGAITAGATLLARRKLGTTETRVVNTILNSARRMDRMINQGLDMARSRLAGGIPLHRSSANLANICEQAIAEARTARPDISIRFRSSAPGAGRWDTDRMAQVVSNLISNAIHHGRPGGSVDVQLRVGSGELRLSVHNEGRPIPADLRAVIFDPFRRAASASKTAGLGLGLYIANEIVKEHGGHIDFSSTQRRGTTFTVVLPVELETRRTH